MLNNSAQDVNYFNDPDSPNDSNPTWAPWHSRVTCPFLRKGKMRDDLVQRLTEYDVKQTGNGKTLTGSSGSPQCATAISFSATDKACFLFHRRDGKRFWAGNTSATLPSACTTWGHPGETGPRGKGVEGNYRAGRINPPRPSAQPALGHTAVGIEQWIACAVNTLGQARYRINSYNAW